MLSVEEARAIIERVVRPLAPLPTPLERALGRTLAADLHAAGDSPPFAKSLVDGYALRTQDLQTPTSSRLRVVDEIDAGGLPRTPLGCGEAALVMTGAPLPEGADAVVMIEHVEAIDGFLSIARPVRRGQNRLARGAEYRTGEVLCAVGTHIGPTQIGLLASAGIGLVRAYPAPSIAIIATGNELVPFEQAPGPGQIRNSNGPMLAALLGRLGADPKFVSTAHLRDELPRLKGCFEELLEGAAQGAAPDILVLSGGVSAGRRDLVPDALVAAGFKCVFHKVALKPGKPLWFGVGPERGDRPPVLAVGLPGNPVSGLVCSLLFIKPAIEILSGRSPAPMTPQTASLSSAYQHEGDRMTFQPVRILGRDPLRIEPMRWAGSADLRTVAQADGFAALGPGNRRYELGEGVGFLPLPAV